MICENLLQLKKAQEELLSFWEKEEKANEGKIAELQQELSLYTNKLNGIKREIADLIIDIENINNQLKEK